MKKPKYSVCAICLQSRWDKVKYTKNFTQEKDLNVETFSARRLPDKIHGTIVRCTKCGLVRTLETIDREQLNRLYSNSNFTYGELTSNLRETYRQILKIAMKYVFKKSSFLEIGCGNGFMLEEAKLLGFRRVRGLEPSIDAISQAPKTVKKYIVNDILKEKTLSPSRFDLICLFQVFDHIPNPNEFLEICHKLLKPKGILVIMNHDVLSSSAKFLGERSPIFDIEHTYLYDKNTMRQILVNNHFRIRTIYSPQAIMTFRYIMRLLPLPKVVKRFFSNLKCPLIDWTVKFHPGNICAIAVKK